MSKFRTRLGPTHDSEGRLSGELYEELQNRAEEKRQLAAVHQETSKREARMKRRMDALDLEPEEWRYEVQKRDRANDEWAREWQQKQQAINGLMAQRQDIKVALLELRQELGRMASVEEQNGNYKAADMLRMVTLRLKAVVEDKIEQDRKGQDDNGEHRKV